MGTYKKLILSICSFFIFQMLLTAQCENIFVHFDKPFYVVGETVWYKAYLNNCPSQLPSSEVLHIELVNKKGEVKAQQKLKIEDNISFGEIKIPTNWSEGLYTIRVYTLLLPGPVVRSIYAKGLPIYNDFEIKAVSTNGKLIPNKETGIESDLPLKIILNTNEESYGKRNEVTLNIDCKTTSGEMVPSELSITVRDARLFPNIGTLKSLKNINEFQTNPELLGAPEKGVTIYSRLFDENNNPLKIPLLSNYNVEGLVNYWGGSDDKGNASLMVPDFTGSKTFQMYEIGAVKNLPRKVELRSPLSNDAPIINAELPYNSLIVDYLSLSKKRKQFNQIFKLEEKEIVAQLNDLVLIEKPDRIYKATDYIDFADTEEFLREVVIPMRLVKNKKDQFELRLTEENDGVPVYKPPLILIDNYVTFDVEELLKLDVRDIDRIELLLRKKRVSKRFGAFARNGVMMVYTKSQTNEIPLKNANNIIEVEGFHISKNFEETELKRSYGVGSAPDLRPILYWNPSIQTDQSGKAVIQFNTSDDLTDYLIEVVGLDQNGKPGRSTKIFKVQK